MKKQRTKKIISYHKGNLPADNKTDWKRVDAMSESELKRNARLDKDTIPLDSKFWESARIVMPSSAGKERITVRIDSDVLQWLKVQGRGYQSRINTILRTCMNALKTKSGHHQKHRH
jgi:uncharacterized protein (DUF4415 family)